jgi:hypothetical protein
LPALRFHDCAELVRIRELYDIGPRHIENQRNVLGGQGAPVEVVLRIAKNKTDYDVSKMPTF